MIKKISLFVLALSFCKGSLFSQDFNIGGGFEIISPVNTGEKLVGLTAFADFADDSYVVKYLKLGFFLPKMNDNGFAYLEAVDPMHNPYYTTTSLEQRMGTFMVEGGTKYFFINAYDDMGFALTAETKVRILVHSIKDKVGEYDPLVYKIDQSMNIGQRQTALLAYIGLGGGAKYSFSWGTIFSTVGLDLSVLGNLTPPIYSPFLFSVQVGYRKDLY
jgi:hypothetical protein